MINNHVAAIDAGTKQTAILVADYSNSDFIFKGIVLNSDLINILRKFSIKYIAVEHIKSYGMPVGDTTIATCYMNGRIIQYAIDNNINYYLLPRKTIVNNICHSTNANDSNIRKALLNLYPDAAKQGFKKDLWSSLAIYQSFIDLCKSGRINEFCGYKVFCDEEPEGWGVHPSVLLGMGEGMRTTATPTSQEIQNFLY